MEIAQLQSSLGAAFGGLWTIRRHGKVTEVVTPFCTFNDDFVSVFIQAQARARVVSDGGWVGQHLYANHLPHENATRQRLMGFYMNEYGIRQVTDPNGVRYFYKKSHTDTDFASAVYDVASFVQHAVNLDFLPLAQKRELLERETFRTAADTFVSALTERSKQGFDIRLNKDLDDLEAVRFNTIVSRNSRMALINYVTGPNPANFIASISRSIVNFELADKSKYRPVIAQKICVVNDKAEGYVHPKIDVYLDYLNEKTTHPVVLWSKREELYAFCEQL